MNKSINTDSKNSKEPQQKYRLGTVSIKILGGLNRFYRRLTSPSASIMAQNIQLFGPRGGFLINGSSRETNKSQINTMMKQRWGLDRNVLRPTPGDPWGVEQHHWNTGAEENQQLNPGGPSNRQKSPGPNQLKQTAPRRGHHRARRPTHRRATKEGSKAINRDWAKHQACRLPHHIHVTPNTPATNDNPSEPTRKTNPTYNFFESIHQATTKLRFR